jgi:hypothetical protein
VSTFNQKMAMWIGKSVDELIINMGPPDSEAGLSTGGKVIEYKNNRQVAGGGGSYTVMVPHFDPVTQTHSQVPQQKTAPSYNFQQSCKLIFTINPQGNVDRWSSIGQACHLLYK